LQRGVDLGAFATPLLTNTCTKRVLSSIVTHSYLFRPCWVIFREKFSLSFSLKMTQQGRNMYECVIIDEKTLCAFVDV
jgi:hypothetical protein